MEDVVPRARPAFVVVVIILTIIGSLAAVELAFRLASSESRTAAAVEAKFRVRRHDGYYTRPRNTTFSAGNERGQTISIETDEKGLRNPPGSYSAADTIVLGDSFVENVNTPAALTLVGQLRARGIHAYTAGVIAMGTFSEFYLLRDHLPDSGTRTVVLGFYLGNDFHDNYWGNFIEGEEARAMPALVTSGKRSSVSSRIAGVVARVCSHSQTCRWVHGEVFGGRLDRMVADPMTSWAIAEMLMLRSTDPRAEVAVIKTKAVLGKIAALVASRGGRLLVLGIPSKGQVLRSFKEIEGFMDDSRSPQFASETFRGEFSWDRPDRILSDLCGELTIPYVSLLDAFRSAAQQEPYYNLDAHWRDVGQHIAADVLTPALATVKRSASKLN